MSWEGNQEDPLAVRLTSPHSALAHDGPSRCKPDEPPEASRTFRQSFGGLQGRVRSRDA